MMNLIKLYWKIILTVLLVIVAASWHLLLGSSNLRSLRDGVVWIETKSIFSHIGANVIAIDSGNSWVIVDTQLAPITNRIISMLQSHKNLPVSHAIVTHWHPDHSGGIDKLPKETTVIAHKSVAQLLAADHEGFGLTSPDSHHQYSARDIHGLPGLLVDKVTKFQISELRFDVIPSGPAHTDGDVIVHSGHHKIIALGDLVWPGTFPFIDVHNGGSVSGLIESLEHVISLSNSEYLFVTGHGQPMKMQELLNYITMLKQTQLWVKENSEKGLQQLQTIGLPEKWRIWQSKLVTESRWIELLFTEN